MAKQRKGTPREQLTEDIIEHLDYIQSTIDGLTSVSGEVQTEITRMVRDQIQRFEIKDGRFVPGPDIRRRILYIEERLERILSGKIYTNAITDYIGSFQTIQNTVTALHKTYNELEADKALLSPARQLVYEAAKDALYGSGIDYSFKAPVKHMLLMQATTGGSISDMEKILEHWQQGEISAGSKSPTGKPIPNLQQYTTQLSRDTSYQFNGQINEIIAQEYGLDAIHYAGDIIRDSRPLCVHIVKQRRDIPLTELETLLNRPDLKEGRIPGTTIKNFNTYRGGYSCRHMSFPVRTK